MGPMAPTSEPDLPHLIDPAHDPVLTEFSVQGEIPAGLSGRLLGIGAAGTVFGSNSRLPGVQDGMVHSVVLDAGRCLSYQCGWVITDAVAQRLGVEPSPGPRNPGPDRVADKVIYFGGSILALGEGTLAYELTPDLATVRRVDLAGQSRGLCAHPKLDPVSRDLHLLAITDAEHRDHVVVSSGALTRSSRAIAAPAPVRDLAITRDRVVLVTDGFIGVTSREGDANVTWVRTGIDAPDLVAAHDVGVTTVIYVVTPSLERWTVNPPAATIHRAVLDSTPRRFARTNALLLDAAPRFAWSTGDATADKHDLVTGRCVRHAFGSDRTPGDLVFVADAARSDDPDSGWLLGFVHHTSGSQTDLVVLDAADLAQPAIATVHIPRRIPRGLNSTWIARTSPINHNEGDKQ
jgi:8'-apo-carotenoid 13,14-cleaving dioxygenase